MKNNPTRKSRIFYCFIFLAALLLAFSMPAAAAETTLPILFVHGNGDSAALWYTTFWRFESNGYDPSLLFAIDFRHPTARMDDTRPQENRSGTADQARELAAKITEIQARTGQKQLILVGSSRGGNAIRNYVKNFGGAPNVARAVLCGTPNHGVQANPENLNNEFNGSGPFLSGLNAGEEVVPGVQFMTTRSDSNDKYAQPDGRFLGNPGKPTNVTYSGPELRGAKNVVLPWLDHREVAFHAKAFSAIYPFVAGGEPKTLDIIPQPRPVLNGMVSGFANGAPSNIPISGATMEIHRINPLSGEREGGLVHKKTISGDGLWGPFTAHPEAHYEFVVTAEGYPITHNYRPPFPRSSPYIHFRLKPLSEREKGSGSLITLSRPRGYL
ncbi:MAG TPA: alpha/beta fold hydrolase, partial [Thermodesulfobacteriota bacterium]|nr:alpha/beta fold hydrolase [Thermodesulfobacteriota bacterium]